MGSPPASELRFKKIGKWELLLSHVCTLYVVTVLCVRVCVCLSHNPAMPTLLLGSCDHTRSSSPSHSPWHHEPLDSSDGLPSGYHRHPYGEGHPDTLPVGSRIHGGQALWVWVGIFFALETTIWLIHKPNANSGWRTQENVIMLFLGLFTQNTNTHIHAQFWMDDFLSTLFLLTTFATYRFKTELKLIVFFSVFTVWRFG